MNTISTMRTGHQRLANGSLLRVDMEFGRWVGSLYTQDMQLKSNKSSAVTSTFMRGLTARPTKQRNELAS